MDSRLVRMCMLGFLAFINVRSNARAQDGTDPPKLLNEKSSPGLRIAYGSDPLQFGELRTPKGKGPFPVAILIHGGCWENQLAPDVPAAITSYQLLSPAATALNTLGIATWNVEYRRVGNPGGGWPNSYLDISQATDHIRMFSKQHHLDLKRVLLIGHSSGGQLALWAAGRSKLPTSSTIYTASPLPVNGVIDIDGPPDIASFWPLQQEMCGAPVITQFMGGTPREQPKRYAEGAVTGLLPIGVVQFIVARSKPEELLRISQDYAERAQRMGDAVTVRVQSGRSHFDAINPETPDWKMIATEAEKLIEIKHEGPEPRSQNGLSK